MPIKYMGECSEHKASFVPNICSEVELFRTYKLPIPHEAVIETMTIENTRPTLLGSNFGGNLQISCSFSQAAIRGKFDTLYQTIKVRLLLTLRINSDNF